MGACLEKQRRVEKKTKKVQAEVDNLQVIRDGKDIDMSKKGTTVTVLKHYELVTGKKGMLGEGSFSVVQKGKDTRTGHDVAIKMYKSDKSIKNDVDEMKLILTKFKRQIEVLKLLMAPIEKAPKNERLNHPFLHKVDPKRMFLELLDYSKDKNGSPGADPTDGKMYVITEVADYSMKDYLAARNEQGAPLSYDTIRSITKSFIAVVACLHAKGLVHLDIKPENMMRAGKHWKLIDVDGCTPISTKISINDSSISFSPCYCAPEWANFLIEDAEHLKVGDGLDVWSVGVSLCELIVLDAVLKPKYAQIYRHCGSHRKAGFLFLEWLANMDEGLSLDKKILDAHQDFVNLVVKKMLNKNAEKRITLAECLSHPFIETTPCSAELLPNQKEEVKEDAEEKKLEKAVAQRRRNRIEEEKSEKPPLLKTVLYKLNADGDLKNKEHWNKRDTWLASNGAICYFSVKKNKRLVLVPDQQVIRASVRALSNSESSMEHGFELKIELDKENEASAIADDAYETQYYAAESASDQKNWIDKLTDVINLKYQEVDTKLLVSKGLIEDYRDFKIQIRNRREKIEEGRAKEFKPVYKCELWKLNQEGDPMNTEHWLQREIWIAKNGALCYYSKKEQRELQYYKSEEIRVVKVGKIPEGDTCKENVFYLQLPDVDGLEFAPAMFAANTAKEADTFVSYIKKFQRF